MDKVHLAVGHHEVARAFIFTKACSNVYNGFGYSRWLAAKNTMTIVMQKNSANYRLQENYSAMNPCKMLADSCLL